jgi:hypothetical protein
MKRAIVLTALLFAASTLSSCMQMMQKDFDKATCVGTFSLADQHFRQTIVAPAGDANVMLAFPGRQCSKPQDRTLTIEVNDANGLEFRKNVRLSQLTWATAQGSCDAYGYLEEGSPKGPIGMTIHVPNDHFPMTVTIDLGPAGVPDHVEVGVWLIYGERAPTTKIFERRSSARL